MLGEGLQHMQVVVDANLIWNRQHEGVGRHDRLVGEQLRDEPILSLIHI